MAYITLTGADDGTSLDDLWRLSGQYRHGLVEWGVLYSVSNPGQGRYPSFAWIERLSRRLVKERGRGMEFALHVCGKAAGDYLAGNGLVCKVAKPFGRIQLNFRHGSYPLDLIKEALGRNPDKQIITQHNDANRDLWVQLAGHGNHAVLFDSSGGHGVVPERWPSPLEGVACGYAGGLGPDNLALELPRIHEAAGGKHYWIDMESGLRDDAGRFDLGLAARCLDQASRFYALMSG